MKNMKRLASFLLMLVLVMSLSVSAFAANDGSITINNAVKGQTYKIYRILDLESFVENGAHSYKTNPWWGEPFLASEGVSAYLSKDTNGYVTWVGEDTDARAKEFAALAKKFAEDAEIQANDSKTADGTTVSFTGLPLGYYLVESTVGTLCSLDTTNKTAEVEDKNEVPSSEKEVLEGTTYGKVNDVSIGDTVTYRATITAKAGAENYVFHDKMSAGLTFDGASSVTVKKGDDTITAGDKTYTINTSPTDNDTFDITFAKDFCDGLAAGDTIVVSYTATVNKDAVVASTGNKNESKLSYGDSSKSNTTPPSETKTYTWKFDVLKYANGKETDVLEGVEFVLLNSDKSKVAKVTNSKITEWVAVPEAGADGTITWPAGTTLTTGSDGKFEVAGLDSNTTYYLRETKALEGYNKLTEDKEVKIVSTNGTTTMTQNAATVKVENKSGTELPETGGIGTTIFYALGGVLAVGAAVLLVTKKRMKNEEQ